MLVNSLNGRVRMGLVAFFLASMAMLPSKAEAVIYLTLGGSQSTNNYPYQVASSHAGSASIALGIGEYMRLGLTHREEVKTSEYYQGDAAAPDLYWQVTRELREVSNSMDLTVILYAGDVFVPFISGGGIVKNYYSKEFVDRPGAPETTSGSNTSGLVPNVGAGVGIRLNRDFSLKLSYTVSPGKRQVPGGEAEDVYDNYAEVGLTYQL